MQTVFGTFSHFAPPGAAACPAAGQNGPPAAGTGLKSAPFFMDKARKIWYK